MRLEAVLLILAMAAAVFITKLIPIAFFGAAGMPPWAGRWLKHVPVAVFAALVAPAVLMPQGHISLSPANHHLLAGGVAAVLAWRSGNFVLTVTAGTAAMLALRWFGL